MLEAVRRIQSQSRYIVSSEEVAVLTGRDAGSNALKMALLRLAKQGLITCVSKRPTRWLIVPPEHAHYGAPPVDWWLDDLLKEAEPSHYLALLSAARYWGSAHYALQIVQVMIGRPRRSLCAGQRRVDFFVKEAIAHTPTVTVRKGVAPFCVSTREATLLDLLRHQADIGGIEAVARIAKDFSSEITESGLTLALDAMNRVATAQRLGHVLEHLGLSSHATSVASWLRGKHRNVQRLEPFVQPNRTAETLDSRWGVLYLDAQKTLLKELT